MVIAVLVVLGLILGSFTSASVWRIQKQTLSKKITPETSILHGRSICMSCKHKLGLLDLIPLFSWVFLRGKCRYCHKPISFQEPIVELSTAILFVASYLFWSYRFNAQGKVLFFFWLIFLLGFIALTIYDLRWRLLPNRIVTPLIYLALLQIVVRLIFFDGGLSLVLGSTWGILFSAGLFYGIFIVSKGTWIGGGDVKLAIALGLLLGGPTLSILMVFLASLIGCLVSLVLVIMKRMHRKSMIAFGPLLMSATIICYLFGNHILDWYKNFLVL